jgi:glycine/D-amino acid oxidase-like deaminating enzyme/NADPH-dependent 2,4-dienoyl-CoA reductase/sulfur reductase-like enzyme/Fe-S-cluster-containing hydrogenase component 2
MEDGRWKMEDGRYSRFTPSPNHPVTQSLRNVIPKSLKKTMRKITKHPILDIPVGQDTEFVFEGKKVKGQKGFTIAAALHQAGYPVHSHSLQNRTRSLECGIGKCGACEMLVDGEIRRICITKIDGVKEVNEIPKEFHPGGKIPLREKAVKVYKTQVAIIGAGPAGLAAREELNNHGIENIVIDNNDQIGGQFLMQTHQFFFFEKEKKFGGMRGFEIAETLAGDDRSGIFLNSVVWDIFENNRLAVKNIADNEVYYIDADYLVIATGAVPYMPSFQNDDLPGVYTAAVVQKMMNQEFTLLGKNILTVGAGNIGYLTSYQLMQAGAKVKAILEAQSFEGGFPVQANRVRRLGIPVLTSKILVKAIPNEAGDGIVGAVVADCVDFKAVPGTEQLIDGIDAINICTGLVSDDQLLIKGNEIFGRRCYGAGDAIRIGEGTSAVLRGKQVAFEILEQMGKRFDYNKYLSLSKEYIDSQQHPLKVIEKPFLPSEKRREEKAFVIIDCLYGFACNPCEFACPHGAITKTSTSTVPQIDFDKCIGCMECVYQCPGLAIFGYNLKKDWLFFPVEYQVEADSEVLLVDNKGKILGNGLIEKVLKKKNKTNIARVRSLDLHGDELMEARGFILKESYPSNIEWKETDESVPAQTFICHCDDVKMEDILEVVGEREFISVDEIKHTTRLGMGACRGKRCIKRLKQSISEYGISVVGEPTPRGPLSNQLNMGELYPVEKKDEINTWSGNAGKHKVVKVQSLIAGGGIGGSSLFRYLAEAGEKPVLLNYGHGASWRNIAGGRPAFSVPELSDIAGQNLHLFEELQKIKNIDFRKTRYVNFAHDEASYKSLEASMAWQDSYMVDPVDFTKEISPAFNASLKKYKAALISMNCWQATPGKTVDLLRQIGIKNGGEVKEDTRLVDVRKEGNLYKALVKDHQGEFVEYQTGIFINALGPEGGDFARMLGIETGAYPVRHQAFITRRLPMLGINNTPLDMLIDRRKYKGFIAVYGQQLGETGQIIGCASPAVDSAEAGKNLKVNNRAFAEIVSEVFIDWLPELSSVGFQAIWSGYYVEPRMIIDPQSGLFIGLRGQGFMLGQYLAKLYVDELMGKAVPEYFRRLSLGGDGMLETAFK